ncbi:MAG: DUF5678 domain-containing protein [bacterium]
MRKNLKTKAHHLKGSLEDPSEAEFLASRKMLPKLLKHYEGEHVAIELSDNREFFKGPLEKEFRAFRKMLPRLLKKYKDEYVAIYQGKLIGHHVDDCELAQSAYEKIGKVPFLLTRVSRYQPIEELPSPEEL